MRPLEIDNTPYERDLFIGQTNLYWLLLSLPLPIQFCELMGKKTWREKIYGKRLLNVSACSKSNVRQRKSYS